MHLPNRTWRTKLAAAIVAAFAVATPQQALASFYDMPGKAEKKFRITSNAAIVAKVEVRYLSCKSGTAVDKSWRDAGTLLAYQQVIIRYDPDCTLKIELSCGGCHGRGQFETLPGNESEGGYMGLNGNAFRWGVSKIYGARQIGNNLARCGDIAADLC